MFSHNDLILDRLLACVLLCSYLFRLTLIQDINVCEKKTNEKLKEGLMQTGQI